MSWSYDDHRLRPTRGILEKTFRRCWLMVLTLLSLSVMSLSSLSLSRKPLPQEVPETMHLREKYSRRHFVVVGWLSLDRRRCPCRRCFCRRSCPVTWSCIRHLRRVRPSPPTCQLAVLKKPAANKMNPRRLASQNHNLILILLSDLTSL